MKDEATLKKTITVNGQQVTLFSLDGGRTWASNVEELRAREERREREAEKQRRYAAKIFSKTRNYLNNV